MPKLARTKKPSGQPTGPGGSAKQSNPMLLLGFALAVAAFILFWVLASGAAKKAEVLVASGSIPPFSTIQDGQLKAVEVPADSITANDLTPEEFEAKKAQGKALISRVEILPGQRLDAGAVSAASLGSLSSVKDDERVVAMPASFPGATAGISIPGSVVDVYRTETGGNAVETAESETGDVSASNLVVANAKVLAVGVGPETAANVRPESKLKNSEEADSGGSVVVVLAVPENEAGKLVGAQQVWLALDPHYSFLEDGTICEISKCAATGKRAQSGQTDPADAQDPGNQIQETETETTEAQDPAAEEQIPDPTDEAGE